MYPITIIGLGAGDLEQLSLGVYRTLKEASHIMARTTEHPVIAELQSEGIQLESFDAVYEKHDAFEKVYEEIVETLIRDSQTEAVTYVVPGHPLVAEKTVQLLIEREQRGEVTLHIVGGNSFLDPIFTALRIDPIEGFQLLDGTDFSRDEVRMTEHILIGQVYDSFIASEVKLSLMEKYAYNHPVTIVTAAGSKGEKLTVVPLFELDRETEVNNLTTVYVPPVEARADRLKEWSTFREIIAHLRSPEGCPWDREQTHETLKKYIIEETHELVEAIEQEDDEGIIEELGDVLLQVFLHAQIGEEDGYFTLEDVLEAISDKMIRRHPHVFGEGEAVDAAAVVRNWQQLKAAEKDEVNSVLDDQKRMTSSLLTSFNYQKEAAKFGFDWPTIDGALEKLTEELQEFSEAIQEGTVEQQIDELGDVLFTVINVARFLKISPEEAMIHANQKFKRRFTFVEQSVREGKGRFDAYRLDELEAFWQLGKQEENL